ncbi:MAG: hypothetical protein ACI9IA_000048 [Enterobacterales bacterium]|jgi:hypothetical protein
MSEFTESKFQLKKYLMVFVSLPIICLFIMGVLEYPGDVTYYIIFSVVSNTLLYFGFRENAIFFDAFIGVLLWLGFWLKFSFRLVFLEATFNDPIGIFSGTASEFDYAMLVCSVGLFALILASAVREKFIFCYKEKMYFNEDASLFLFYKNNRVCLLLLFLLVVVVVSASNLYLGIYQRGTIPKTVLPYGLGGVYSWLLLFGLSSFSALIIWYELILKKKTIFLVIFIALIESFFSCVSLLSRAMVINSSSLLYGYYKTLRLNKIVFSKRYCAIIFCVFFILFAISVYSVNYMRLNAVTKLAPGEVMSETTKATETISSVNVLLIDRWVGIEGVLAVSSYNNKGWELWNRAWQEKILYDRASIYDADIALPQNINPDFSKHHFLSVPGVIAFWFYPGSFMFLMLGMFCLGLAAALIEVSVYYLGGKNLILCALLAQVVAYRYAHFGYVPQQSYLLFGALYLNLFLIYFSNVFFTYWYRSKS